MLFVSVESEASLSISWMDVRSDWLDFIPLMIENDCDCDYDDFVFMWIGPLCLPNEGIC